MVFDDGLFVSHVFDIFSGGPHQVSIMVWPEKITAGTALEIMQGMDTEVKRWMSQLKCNHVVAGRKKRLGFLGPCLLLIWDCYVFGWVLLSFPQWAKRTFQQNKRSNTGLSFWLGSALRCELCCTFTDSF